MKTKLLLHKTKITRLNSFLLLFICFNFGWGQQIIGEFPTMDGGLEGQTATTTVSSIGSTGTPSETNWSVSSTGNSEVRTISDVTANARTGNYSAAIAIKSTATNTRLQAPTPVTPTFQMATEYTIQFHYKTDTNPGSFLDGGIYLNSTSGGVASDVTNETPFAAGEWIKGYSTITTGAVYNALNWAVARLSTPTAGEYTAVVNFDDFVVYAGGYDNTAPAAATAGSFTINTNSTTISWSAASNATDSTDGIIGGGYLVVRYASMPNDDNDPNQNGIYKVGNTTTNGTASLEGTVVYIGTSTTFDEPYQAGAYYKIYTVDKAFNYSEELLVMDPNLAITQNQLNSFKIYPNPAKDIITINSLGTAINSVVIYSLEGKQVINKSNTNQIDISNLSSGLYLVKIYADNSETVKKLVIK